MPLINAFNYERHVMGHGISIKISSSEKPSVTFHNQPVRLPPIPAVLLAIMIENPIEGASLALIGLGEEEFAHVNLPSIIAIERLKVHISKIRSALAAACPNAPMPIISPLYSNGERTHSNFPGEYKNGYILTAPIIGKPSYGAIRAVNKDVLQKAWELHVDVAALSQNPEDIRVYKRRINDWQDGIVCVGNKPIPLSKLQTAAVAQTLLAHGAPVHSKEDKLPLLSPDATKDEPLFSFAQYEIIIRRAATLITDAMGEPSIADRLIQLSGRQGILPTAHMPSTFG